MHIHRPRYQAGFTLVELLTVVLILGIVTAVVLPQIGPHDDLKVASAARELTADLLYAQSQAIATGKIHYVVFDTNRQTYTLMDCINPPRVLVHPALSTPFEISFRNGPLENVTVAGVNFDGSQILAFDGLGSPLACMLPAGQLSALTTGSIVLCSGEYRLSVTIGPGSGEIKVQ